MISVDESKRNLEAYAAVFRYEAGDSKSRANAWDKASACGGGNFLQGSDGHLIYILPAEPK